ncbi:MAG: hypothetical protein JWR66_1626 [Modestobacter sp.]|nr:hypothetical protein [Modestobacter sp.]
MVIAPQPQPLMLLSVHHIIERRIPWSNQPREPIGSPQSKVTCERLKRTGRRSLSGVSFRLSASAKGHGERGRGRLF